MKKIINLILLLLFCNIIKLGAQTYAIPPNGQTTINGVNISSSSVGFVDQWPVAYASLPCYQLGAKSIRVGYNASNANGVADAPWVVTLKFDRPVNNLVFVIGATGSSPVPSGREDFNFTANQGAVTISAITSCNTTITGNKITGGLYGDYGGGGAFKITSTTWFTQLTISGQGGLAGSLIALKDFISKPLCYNSGLGGTPDGYTNVGITTQTKQQVWPGNVPNGFLALESSTKGMVITRVPHVSATPNLVTDAIKDPKEGMLVYDIQDKCTKLYNGTIWNCIKNTCDSSGETPRKIRLGSYGSWVIGGNAFPAYNSQLTNPVNYGPTGTFKGITGFEFSNITSLLETTTAAQLKVNYDIINGFFEKVSSTNAQKIADYVKLGGVAIINIDNPQYDFSAILNSFGITGPYSSYGEINARSSITNQLSNVFGDTKDIALLGSDTQGRVLANQLPSTSTIYANETAVGGGVAVWTIGGDFKGKVIFVWDEGIFRTPISGTVIDTSQEKFVHNLMAYALVQLGFQP